MKVYTRLGPYAFVSCKKALCNQVKVHVVFEHCAFLFIEIYEMIWPRFKKELKADLFRNAYSVEVTPLFWCMCIHLVPLSLGSDLETTLFLAMISLWEFGSYLPDAYIFSTFINLGPRDLETFSIRYVFGFLEDTRRLVVQNTGYIWYYYQIC